MQCGFAGGDGAVYVVENADRLIGAPAQTAAEEGTEQHDAVVELDFGTGHVELVAEPVDVEKGRRELVKDEGWGVKVDKGSLGGYQLVDSCMRVGGAA